MYILSLFVLENIKDRSFTIPKGEEISNQYVSFETRGFN